MKYLYTIIILSILSISGCSNNESENDLKQENEQLKLDNKRLLVDIEELELDLKIVSSESSRKNDLLFNKISSLKAENETQRETINRYQEAFEIPISNNHTITESLSIFSPDHVKSDSQIAGLVVSDIKKEAANDATSYFINFTGEFEVKGSIIHFGGVNEYSFIVKENLKAMPHTLWQFEKGSIFFDITNVEDLRKSLGDKLDALPEDGQLDIVGVFKNYSYNYVPESDFPPNFAEFVRVKSEN